MSKFWSSVLRAKIAVVVIAIGSVGGVAAAASVTGEPTPSVTDEVTTTTLVVDDPSTTTTEPAPDPDLAVAPDAGSDDPVPTDAPESAECESHGERVSRIAHETPPGPGHGTAVSEAARSHEGECGDEAATPPSSAPASDDDAEVEDQDEDDRERGQSGADESGSSDHGNGNGRGNGKNKD